MLAEQKEESADLILREMDFECTYPNWHGQPPKVASPKHASVASAKSARWSPAAQTTPRTGCHTPSADTRVWHGLRCRG